MWGEQEWWSLGALQGRKLSLPCWILPQKMTRIFFLSAVSIRERSLCKRAGESFGWTKAAGSCNQWCRNTGRGVVICSELPFNVEFQPSSPALGFGGGLETSNAQHDPLNHLLRCWGVLPHHPLRFHASTCFVVDTIFEYSSFYLGISAQR